MIGKKRKWKKKSDNKDKIFMKLSFSFKNDILLSLVCALNIFEGSLYSM